MKIFNFFRKNLINCIIVLLAVVTLSSAAAFCWLAKPEGFTLDFKSSTATAYFAGGDGSKDDPYQINNPIHLYNLAWLQYLGYFNLRSGANNGRAQSYFVLTADIAMDNLTLPPIGTAEYPFIGHFNGSDYAVTGLVVSNGLSDFTVYPKDAKFTNNTLYTYGNTETVSYLGMFGVTGNYNTFVTDSYTTTVHSVSETLAESTTPSKDEFYMSEMSVSRFYLDTVEVKSCASTSLVGLVAGYVCSNLENIGVYQSKISFTSAPTSTPLSSTDSVVSKYALVGEYDSGSVSWSDGDEVTTQSWGGSVDMSRLYNRVSYAYSNSSKSYDSSLASEYSGSSSSYEFKYYNGFTQITDSDNVSVTSKISGSYYLRQSGTTYYLQGKQQSSQEKAELAENNFGGFKITNASTSRQLFVNFNNANKFFFMSSSSSSFTTFYIEKDDSNYYLYVDKNGDKYYVYSNGSTLTLDQTNKSVLTLDLTISNSDISGTKIAFDGKYLSQSGNNMYYSLSSSSSTTFNLTLQEVYKTVLKYEVTENNATRSTQTYLPINTETEVDSDGNVIKNTGYFASGSGEGIRMDTHTYSDKTVYTIGSNGKVEQDATDSDFIKVKNDCSVTTNGSGYGLHFMEATVDMNNLYTIPSAKIKDTTYTNRQMTANSVDFIVEQKGTIRFLAGTSYTNNNSFFTLYHISRSGNTITAINEISKIYSNGDSYIYLYSNGETYPKNSTISENTLVFDCDWITNPGSNLESDSLYYFAIPVNSGEYALGSGADLVGAYLYYLDIGANNSVDTSKRSISSVNFVNSSAVEKTSSGSYQEYAYETFSLSVSSSGAYVVFKRQTTDPDSADTKDTSKVSYNSSSVTVTPKESDYAVVDDALSFPSTDTGE